jgi:AcrR family transcriptional regulator
MMESRSGTGVAPSPSPRRGRPRKAETDQAILAAASELLLAGGYGCLSMEAVAARSGITKPTLYRRWPSKAALVADAFTAGLSVGAASPARGGPLTDSGDIARDLSDWFDAFVRIAADPHNAALIRALIAAAGENPGEAEPFFELLIGPSQRHMAARLQAADAAGQLRQNLDFEALIDVLFGWVLVQLFTGRVDTAPRRARGLLEIVLHGACADGAST